MKDFDRKISPTDDVSGRELSLYDVYRIMARRKMILLGTIIAAQVIAASYVLLQRPYYESAVRLLPGAGYMESMTVLAKYGFESANVDAFASFQQMLGQEWQWRSFVSANGNPPLSGDAEADSPADMEHPISVQSENDNVVVTYRDHDPEHVGAMLLRYLDFVHEKHAAQVVADLTTRLERARREVESKIQILQRRATLQRMDEMERIKMDIDLAKRLGIDEFQVIPLRSGSDGNAIAYIVDGTFPRYMLGVRILSGELEALVERKSDAPYIAGLRDLEIELDQLNALTVHSEGYQAYVQDGDVIGPREFRKIWMMPAIVISTGIGLLIGAFLAIFSELRSRQDNE